MYVEYYLCLQAVQKTFHNLLLLLSIFDLVRTENHHYLRRTLSDPSSSSPSPQSSPSPSAQSSSPFQVYLVTTVPLFSLPQLSSSTEVKHFLTLILPYVLPVAHIGMVITIIIITIIIVDIIFSYILRGSYWNGNYHHHHLRPHPSAHLACSSC